MTTLYGAYGGSVATTDDFATTASDLYTVNTADATLTSVGTMTQALSCMACDPVTGTMYAISSPSSADGGLNLYTLDVATATLTLVAALSGITWLREIGDITFDASGQMYGWINDYDGTDPGHTYGMVKIDKATGVVTEQPTMYPGTFPDTSSSGPGSIESGVGGAVRVYIGTGPGGHQETLSTATGAVTGSVALTNNSTGSTVVAAAYDPTLGMYLVDYTTPKILRTVDEASGALSASIGTLPGDFTALAFVRTPPSGPLLNLRFRAA